MGNNVYGMCKNNTISNDSEMLVDTLKKEMETTSNITKIEMIQNNWKISKVKSKVKAEIKEIEVYFDSVLENVGKFISQEEFDSRVSKDVLKVKAQLPKFEKEKVELCSKKQFNIFSKPPVSFFLDESCYTGQWSTEGKRHGYGILIKEDGSQYEGAWKNDVISGYGRFINTNGNFYEGNWENGFAHGQGKFTILNQFTYEGEWVNDVQHGYGIESYADGSVFEGEFNNGNKCGQGIFKWNDGSMYKGNFVDNNFHGTGLYKWKDERTYEGEWLNNKMHGKGVFKWPDGKTYEGDYKNDKKHGWGIYNNESESRYEGFWISGKQNGKGTIHLQGKIKEGIWRFGKPVRQSTLEE